MVFGYTLSFLLACLFLILCWFCRYRRKQSVLLCAAAVCFLCFLGFTIIDYQQIQFNSQMQQEITADEESFNDILSNYQRSILQEEINIMAQYEWNTNTSDVLDPQNITTAGNILRNVRLSKMYRQLPYLLPDSQEYKSLLQDPIALRGTSYHLSGICLSSTSWDDSLAVKSFLPANGLYALQVVECAWEDGDESETIFVVIYPVSLQNTNQNIPQKGDNYSCSATFIGTLSLEQTEALVFMHN